MPTDFNIVLPHPLDFWSVVFIGMGMTFGGAFGKKLDEEIQLTEWYCRQGKLNQSIVKRILDCLHHWWIGALAMFLIVKIPVPEHPVIMASLFWFSFGIFLDDIKDYKRVLNRFTLAFNELNNGNGNGNGEENENGNDGEEKK